MIDAILKPPADGLNASDIQISIVALMDEESWRGEIIVQPNCSRQDHGFWAKKLGIDSRCVLLLTKSQAAAFLEWLKMVQAWPDESGIFRGDLDSAIGFWNRKVDSVQT